MLENRESMAIVFFLRKGTEYFTPISVTLILSTHYENSSAGYEIFCRLLFSLYFVGVIYTSLYLCISKQCLLYAAFRLHQKMLYEKKDRQQGECAQQFPLNIGNDVIAHGCVFLGYFLYSTLNVYFHCLLDCGKNACILSLFKLVDPEISTICSTRQKYLDSFSHDYIVCNTYCSAILSLIPPAFPFFLPSISLSLFISCCSSLALDISFIVVNKEAAGIFL